MIHTFLQLKAAPGWVMDYAVTQWPLQHDVEGTLFISSRSFLLTWQGQWGLVQQPRAGEPFASDLEALVSQLRASSEVLSNFDALRKRVAEITYIVKADHWACSLELCTSTWGTEKVVRIHGHAFFFCESFCRQNESKASGVAFLQEQSAPQIDLGTTKSRQ